MRNSGAIRLLRDDRHSVVHDPGMGHRVVHRKYYSWLITDVEAAVLEAATTPHTERELVAALVPRFPRSMVLEAIRALTGNGLARVRTRRKLPRIRDHILFPRARVRTGKAAWDAVRATDPRKVLLLRSGECLDPMEPVLERLRRILPKASFELESLPKKGWAKELRRLNREHRPDVVGFYQGRRYSRYRYGVAWRLGSLRVRHKVLFLGGQEILVDRAFAILHPLRIFAKFITLQRAVVWALALECLVLRTLDVLTLGPLARRRSRARAKQKRVILICSGGIGDIASTSGAAAMIKEEWPDCELTMLLRANTEAVARTIPHVDRTVDVGALHAGNPRNPLTYVRWLGRLLAFQREHFDQAAILQWYGFGIRPLVWAYTLLYLTHATRRVAPHWKFPGALKRIPFATEYVTRSRELDQATQAWVLTSAILGRPVDTELRRPPEAYLPVLHPLEEDRIHVREFLHARGLDADREFFLGIAPGTARNKIWSYERFAEVADLAAREFGARVVILGPQSMLMRTVARRMQHPSVVVSDLETNLLPAFIERMDLFLCNDSGPLHLAAAMGVPAVGIFGPTQASVWAPNHAPKVKILRAGDCPPCGEQMRCSQPRRICMESVSVEMVMDALRALRNAPRAEISEVLAVGRQCV